MNHWLLKSEPDSFSIDALAKSPKHSSAWDGVRNFQARNMLRDSIKKGDLAFFYHSSCDVPGIAGIVEIVKSGYPDKTAFDAKHHHYDPDSRADAPRWYVVDVKKSWTIWRQLAIGRRQIAGGGWGKSSRRRDTTATTRDAQAPRNGEVY